MSLQTLPICKATTVQILCIILLLSAAKTRRRDPPYDVISNIYPSAASSEKFVNVLTQLFRKPVLSALGFYHDFVGPDPETDLCIFHTSNKYEDFSDFFKADTCWLF